jgi:hypothetical protein
MSCKSCGAIVEAGSKICGSCGANVDETASAQVSVGGALVALSPLAAGLQCLSIRVDSFEAGLEDWDGVGFYRGTSKIVVRNNTAVDFSHLKCQAYLFTESGLLISETSSDTTETVAVGEETTIEFWFAGIPEDTVGPLPSRHQVVIHVVASRLECMSMSEVSVPNQEFTWVPIKGAGKLDSIAFVGANISKSSGDGKVVDVFFQALIQNLTNNNLPWVQFDLKLIDRQGKEIGDAGNHEAVGAGKLQHYGATLFGKVKQVAGASVKTTLLVHSPVAEGVVQHMGMSKTAIDV